LPNSRSKFSKRKLRTPHKTPESAKNRARLLLGSLNRQNCFAKVLCGLGAREPTTKTGLLNDYVYLMEELVVDDDEDENNGKKSKSKTKKWGKSKKKNKNKKKKPHTKKENDDSDSSMSKSEEDDDKKDKQQDDFEDVITDWNFLADSSLAQEDPQVLKYVKLEEKRRQHKNDLPDSIRRARKKNNNNMTIKNTTIESITTLAPPQNETLDVETESPIPLILPPKRVHKLFIISFYKSENNSK
jgi:hypothetical protein